MKGLMLLALALLSWNAFAARKCSSVITVDPNRKIMIFRFTTQTSSDLVHLMPLNKSCATVIEGLLPSFPRSAKFGGEDYATVFIYKHDPEDKLKTSFHLTVFQQEYEAIELKDKSGLQFIAKEYADRIRYVASPDSTVGNCRLAVSLDWNAKTVNLRLTTATSSDLVDLVPLEGSCSASMMDLVENNTPTIMFNEVEYANIFIYKNDPADKIDMWFHLTAMQKGYEVIPMSDKSGFKAVDVKFKDRVTP